MMVIAVAPQRPALPSGKLTPMADQPPTLVVTDARAWSTWLSKDGGHSSGVWLVLAKKGTKDPTTLTYDQALEEALCHGWVDGQLARGDPGTFRRKFTPRRSGSAWSKRNVEIVNRLSQEGRMKPPGVAVVERARADGTWEAAYAGAATIEVPADLAEALAGNPAAQAMFDQLTGANRYAILYRIHSAKRTETRRKRIDTFVAMLARGETLHPQRS